MQRGNDIVFTNLLYDHGHTDSPETECLWWLIVSEDIKSCRIRLQPVYCMRVGHTSQQSLRLFCLIACCVLQFVSVAGFVVNLIGIMSFRHNHAHHGHSHSAAVTQSLGSASSHCHVVSHSHSATCSAHGHADHSPTPPSSSAVTHNTNMEGSHYLCTSFYSIKT